MKNKFKRLMLFVILYFLVFQIGDVFAYVDGHPSIKYDEKYINKSVCAGHSGDGFVGYGLNTKNGANSKTISIAFHYHSQTTGSGVGELKYSIDDINVNSNDITIGGWAYVKGFNNMAVNTDCGSYGYNCFCYNVVANDLINLKTGTYSLPRKKRSDCTGTHINPASDDCVGQVYGSFGKQNVYYKFRLIKVNDDDTLDYDKTYEFENPEYLEKNTDFFYYHAIKSPKWGINPPGVVNMVNWGGTNKGSPRANHYRGMFTAKLDDIKNKLEPGKYRLQMQFSAWDTGVENCKQEWEPCLYNGATFIATNESNLKSKETWITIGVLNDSDVLIKHNSKDVVKKIENEGQNGFIKCDSWTLPHYFWKIEGDKIIKTGIKIPSNATFSENSDNEKLVGFYSIDKLKSIVSATTIANAEGTITDLYRVNYNGHNDLLIPVNWTTFKSKTDFIVGDNVDNVQEPREQSCSEIGSGYEEISKKDYYNVRRFTSYGNETSRWKQVCAGSVSFHNLDGSATYDITANDIFASSGKNIDDYDINSLKAVRGVTKIAKDETDLNTLKGKSEYYYHDFGDYVYSGVFKNKNVLRLGYNKENGIITNLDCLWGGISCKLKITYIPIIKPSSQYIDKNPACKNNNINLNDNYIVESIYHPVNTEVKFCAKKKDVAVCKNDNKSTVCNVTVGNPKNEKGNSHYYESDKYQACILKEQRDSGFKMVKANGKSVTDVDSVIPKDNTAKTSVNSRYCVVACRDKVDLETPNLKEAFIGSYFELNLSRKTDNNENTTGPTVKYERTCVTSDIKVDGFKEDIKKQSELVQKLYEEYRDLKYIHDNLKVTSHTGTPVWDCTCTSCSPTGCSCCGGHWDCSHSWTLGTSGKIPNGDGGKLLSTGTESLSTIHNFTKSNSKTECPDPTCSGTPYNDDLNYEKENYKKLMDKKWEEYTTAKTEQDLMVEEINSCYKWAYAGEDKLYDGTNPKINYTYDDSASVEVEGDLKVEKVTLPATEPEEQLCYTGIYNNYCNASIQYKSTANWFADCNEDADASSSYEHCYRAYGSSYSHTPLYSNKDYFNIGKGFGLTNAHVYIKRIERKKWNYKIDPDTNTVYTNKMGSFTHGQNFLSIDDYPPSFTIKLSGYSASPIAMSTKEKDGYKYRLAYSNLDDATRKKYADTDDKILLKTKTEDDGLFNTSNHKYVCDYNVKSDGSTSPPSGGPPTKINHINFFYRTIDVRNINPNGRTLGYNWADGNADEVKDLIATTEDYQVLTGNKIKDTSVTTADRTSDGITFTLTPALMKNIREDYNDAHEFSEFITLKCTGDTKESYYCRSPFLECLTGDDSKCAGVDTSLNDTADHTKLTDFRTKMEAKNNKFIN